MRALLACAVLIVAGFTGGALAPTAADAASVAHHFVPPRPAGSASHPATALASPASRRNVPDARPGPATRVKSAAAQSPQTTTAASRMTARVTGTGAARPIAPGDAAMPAGAHARPSYAPKAPVLPAPLAAPPRSGKNAPATLGGPAKYDAKKGAMLGGTVCHTGPRSARAQCIALRSSPPSW